MQMRFSRSFGTNETQQLREGQLVGRMLLATGATGVKQVRGTRTRMRSIYTACLYRSLGLAVQCETWHGAMPASSACIMNSAEGQCYTF